MKRIIYLTLAIVILMGSVSVFATVKYLPDYEITAVDEFRAVGVQITHISNPTDKLQNMMDFTFKDGKPVTRKYVSGDYPEGTVDLGKSTIEMTLVYDKDKLENAQNNFINGTFTYSLDSENGLFTTNGEVVGSIVDLATNRSVFDFSITDSGQYSLLLECYATDSNWTASFVLMQPESGSILTTTEPVMRNDSAIVTSETVGDTVTYRYEESFFSHEERPHIPSPYYQKDVAAGVGISTVGIVIVNALTKTSVFGSASFNGSFNPQAGPSVQPGSGASAGSSAGIASTAQSASAASISQSASTASASGGFIKSIGDFFKGLFEVLRDMLTDEGRSYASGKLTDILSETDVTDIIDK
ncbi:MAG TPA: hypothetical protein PLP30_00225 [Clostridia bacterium]|mgnify:CR=1 FL=1|nr:hypothetical protein [Clostridia bacterium]HPQ45767.1 hypothetical protein [Clostridia bacterium]HRX41696.1 hypothetical protein [Clostridia bacterium]